VVSFGVFTMGSYSCSDLNVTYTTKLINGDPLPIFITFIPGSRQYSIQSVQISSIGTYTIKFTGTINDGSIASSNFILNVLDACPL
jgi:hypothetical protein